MSPLLFQTLIKTLCLFLLWAALANSSIFDNLDNLQTMLQQLETQVQPQPESTTPPIEYFSSNFLIFLEKHKTGENSRLSSHEYIYDYL